uniref:Glutathione S-transferase omega n=1 Tax=Phallusia mammillata TaxID=59560 RepID=A0A6F9DF01_9ASCI|nr:glutathione S-transferase omega-1-like [Phallusia mammillata]
MGEAKHLAKDSELPDPPKQDVLRVYGMKFSPFTHRLKLVLAAKGVEHETVNINLVSKPSWYLSKNHRGEVPVIEINGNIIRDSIVTSQYVDDAYTGDKLTTTDPMKKAKESVLLLDNEKTIRGFIEAAYHTPDKQARGLMIMKEGLEKIDDFLKSTGSYFICGDKPGLTDYMIWPHLERIRALWPICITQFLFVEAYSRRMLRDSAVKQCQLPNSMHRRFAADCRKKKVNYDMVEEIEES